MDLRQIEYFLTLAETRNFSEASERVGVTQPALSKSIQRLEQELGLLFYRDGKDTRLTELARKLMSEFEAISKSANLARGIARTHSTHSGSEVRIGLSDVFAPSAFEPFILSFLERGEEDMHVSTFEVCAGDCLKELLKGDLDAVIGFEVKKNPKIASVPLFDERYFLALPPGHRLGHKPVIRVTDLESEKFIDKVECRARGAFMDWVRGEGVRMTSPVSCHREDWAQHLVGEGQGVTLLAASSLSHDSLILRPVEGFGLDQRIYLHTIFGSCKPLAISHLEAFAKRYDWPQNGEAKGDQGPLHREGETSESVEATS